MNRTKKAGRLATNNVLMELHEYATINVLLDNGEDVELLPRTRTPHSKSADIYMCGLVWEMKSPTGKTPRPIERILHRAAKQSRNVIMDLRRTNLADSNLTAMLEKLFHQMRSVRNLWIITKEDMILKFKKITLAQ